MTCKHSNINVGIKYYGQSGLEVTTIFYLWILAPTYIYILNRVYMDLIYILQGKCQRLKIWVILGILLNFKKNPDKRSY